MKKVISLSIAVMLGISVFAQDSIPGQPKSPTAPGNGNPNLNDTSRSGNKWPKDSVNKHGWPNTDSTLRANTTGTGDSLGNGVANHSGRDTMNSMHQSTPGANSSDSSSAGNNANNKTGNDTSTASSEKLTDRIMMKDDQMFIVKDNQSSILDKDYKLESGATITTDGHVKYQGGKTVKLKNGQFIELTPASDTDGNKTKKTTKSTKKSSSKSTSGSKKKNNE